MKEKDFLCSSIGYNKIQDSIRDEFRICVNGIRFLSIETQGADIIKSITGRDAKLY